MIQAISQSTMEAIRKKSVQNLPDRPSETGMSATDIKKAFYQPLIDTSNSVLSEIDRVISEVNSEIASIDSALSTMSANLERGLYYVDNYTRMYQTVSDTVSGFSTRLTAMENTLTALGESCNTMASQISALQTVCNDYTAFANSHHTIHLLYDKDNWVQSGDYTPFAYIQNLYVFGTNISRVQLVNDDGLNFARYGFAIIHDGDDYYIGCTALPNEDITLTFDVTGNNVSLTNYVVQDATPVE